MCSLFFPGLGIDRNCSEHSPILNTPLTSFLNMTDGLSLFALLHWYKLNQCCVSLQGNKSTRAATNLFFVNSNLTFIVWRLLITEVSE